jgi:DNA-binding transcriptional ArsR family regulator
MVVSFHSMPEKPAVVVATSLRFELFYGMHHFLRSEREFGANAVQKATLPRALLDAHDALGGAAIFWIIANDALEALAPTAGFEAIRQALQGLDAEAFAQRVIGGILHSEPLAGEILARRLTLAEAVAAMPEVKREWLSHVGLYPFRPDAAIARAIVILGGAPEEAKAQTQIAIDAFWDACFGELWTTMAPAYAAATSRLQAQLDRHDLFHCFDALTLPAEYDARKGEIRARRGGYRLALAETAEIYLMPSAFNTWRFWTVDGAGATALFPVLDGELHKRVEKGTGATATTEPKLDLVFRALGKDTRLAIADLLAERPHTAGELAESLGLARSTLSHHLFLLREADLLETESGRGGSKLSLRREPFEQITRAALTRFFPPKRASDS